MTTETSSPGKKKKRKMGRPEKGIKRSCLIMVRLTPTEQLLIEGKAKQAGLKCSAWFRQAAKKAVVVPRFSAEDLKLFRVLAGLANNLNQLTHLAHAAGLLSQAQKCRSILHELDGLIKYLKNGGKADNG